MCSYVFVDKIGIWCAMVTDYRQLKRFKWMTFWDATVNWNAHPLLPKWIYLAGCMPSGETEMQGPNTCIIWHCSFENKKKQQQMFETILIWWCDDRLTRDVRLITALYRVHIQMLCDSIHVTRHMLNVVCGLLIISLLNYGWYAFF